jgi:hypothetical protein
VAAATSGLRGERIISAAMSEKRTAQIVGVVLGLIFAVVLILNALASF